MYLTTRSMSSWWVQSDPRGVVSNLQPEFGIEKRVHVDKMPLDNVQYDEHRDILS